MPALGWIAALSFATELLKFLRMQMENQKAKATLKDVTVALKTAREKGDTSELEAKFAQFGFVRKPNQHDKLQDN